MLSGGLASPTPSKGGEPEERGDEANETQSPGDIQGSGGLRRVQGDKTLAELATQLGVHPTQIMKWRSHLLARAIDVFGGTKSTSDAPDLKLLHAKLGQLTLEI